MYKHGYLVKVPGCCLLSKQIQCSQYKVRSVCGYSIHIALELVLVCALRESPEIQVITEAHRLEKTDSAKRRERSVVGEHIGLYQRRKCQ